MGRPKIGIQSDTEDAVLGAIAKMARDRRLPRTAGKLAELAGVGRATIYRAFDTRPELRDSFQKLVDQSPEQERSKVEHDLAERRAEIRLLKERIAALTATVEHLIRDNNALRQSLAQPDGPPVADLNQRQRSKAR
jgi:AcrR family transcriptional regulator